MKIHDLGDLNFIFSLQSDPLKKKKINWNKQCVKSLHCYRYVTSQR